VEVFPERPNLPFLFVLTIVYLLGGVQTDLNPSLLLLQLAPTVPEIGDSSLVLCCLRSPRRKGRQQRTGPAVVLRLVAHNAYHTLKAPFPF